MVDFVAVIIVEIEDIFPVGCPPIIVNGIVCFVRDRMRVRAVHRAHPNIKHTALVWREPGELRTVGRDLRIGALRISEKNFARNERGQFGVNGEGAKPDECKEKLFHFDCRVPI